MGLFSSKHLIAEMRIALTDSKVFVSMRSVPIGTRIVIHESKLPILLFMYFFDRVLGNMSEKVSAGTMNSVHTISYSYFEQLGAFDTPEKWGKRKFILKGPNKWTFTDKENDFSKSDFTASARLYSKGERMFCETDFSQDQYTEAKAYLMVEAFLSFVTQRLDHNTALSYFLPAVLAQCTFYNGKRPSLFNLGDAVVSSLEQIESLRKNYIDD